MNYSGKAYAELCEKKLINTKWCYRCPNENCTKTSNAYKVENFNDDGRYMYTKEGGGFTAIKQHMIKCLTVERCIELLDGDKNQNKLVGEDLDNSSVNEKAALDFIELVIDANIPLISCNKTKFRNIVYRGYKGSPNRKLCAKTLSKIMHELAKLVQEKVGKDLVSNF